MTDSRS